MNEECLTVPPPTMITVEFEKKVVCPVGCIHCSHKKAVSSDSDAMSVTLSDGDWIIDDACALGVEVFVAYPRNGDVSLEADDYLRMFQRAQNNGMLTKTCTSCVSPEGVKRLLPFLDQLTISIDGFDKTSFSRFRPSWLLNRVNKVFSWIKDNGPFSCKIAGNVVTTRSFIRSGGIELFFQQAIKLGIFSKINILEILPGPISDFNEERLEKEDFETLRSLKQTYRDKIKIVLSRWKPGTPDNPSCSIGRKYLVIGPDGSVAPCVLILHGGLTVANLFKNDGTDRRNSLLDVWKSVRSSSFTQSGRTSLFDAPSHFPFDGDIDICRDKCRLYAEKICFGGCVPRCRLLGREVEMSRHCEGPFE